MLTITLFIHFVNYKSIVEISKASTLRTAALVHEKFRTIALTSEHLVQTTAGFISELGTISPKNKMASDFLLNIIKYNENFSLLFVGTENGEFFGVYSRADTAVRKINAINTGVSLYPGTAFDLHYIDPRYSPPADQWIFFNEDLKPIGKANLTLPGYDTRLRPWYQEAKQTRSPHWTIIYKYWPGPTISIPMFNAKGKFVGVAGATLSFFLLENFLNQQKIGQTGKIFILDNQGKVVIPQTPKDSPVLESLIASAYQSYLYDPTQSHFIFEKNGVKYLTYIEEFPVFTERKWKLAIVVPLKDFFGHLISMQEQLLWLCGAILLLSAIITFYFAKRISTPIVTLSQEILKIGRLELDSKISIRTSIREIFMIDQAILTLRRAIRSFASYVPKEIVELLLQKNEEITLGGEKSEITIIFSDIANFTTIMEEYPIDFILPLLKEYFETMTPPILQSHGTIDKFIGDGIMAFWGAPIFFPDHAQKACTAALQCKAALSQVNKKRREDGKPEFLTRFGINTGNVIVGNFGTEDRMNYTVIGDAVNISARLQEIDKIYHTNIIITQDVYTGLDASFVTRPIDVITVKGKKEKIKIYELCGKIDGDSDIQPTADEMKLYAIFTEAYNTFEQGDFKKAQEIFLSIQEQFPDDYPTQLYLQRFQK